MKANVESQTFNGLVEWYVEGGYIKLLTAVANLKLELYKSGRIVLLAPAVKRGFYQKVDFDQVKITNTGAQLVEFLTAPEEGGSDALTGSFDITSPLAGDNADALAALGAAGVLGVGARLQAYNGATFDRLRADNIGGVGALRMTERGYVAGASSVSATNMAANTPRTIVAPGTNVNGMIVWRASYYSRAGTVPQFGSILAKTSAPASVTDGDVIVGIDSIMETAAPAFTCAGKRERPIFVAAGKGLYCICSAAESGHWDNEDYTLL